ncbi:MAG: esterase-like activity of phytase family protein [Nitrosospira multiformis]|nr:esterase-like activity of phytase family protein [Nitrosospira multiformis]
MVFLLSSTLVAIAHNTSVLAAPAFVNGIAIPGSTSDHFGSGVNNGRVGFFSDIYYDTNRNEWWGLSDRGPGGGTMNYDTRVQRFTLDVDKNTGSISNFQVAETIKFMNGANSFNGFAPNPINVRGNSFDPEGLVVNPHNGHLLVSDEYGPSLYEFDRTGQFVRSFTVPANIIPRDAADIPNYASNTGNIAGKRSNRGFEGLAISPDGQNTYAMLQSAMLDEGGGNGVYDRIVKFDNTSGTAVAQYAYKMEGSTQGRGTSALVAINDHEFMVIERNNRGVGVDSELTPANKKVFTIDLDGATDVTAVDLDSNATFTAVAKNNAPFIDLAADTLTALGGKVPEKWEGLAIGPRLDDGSYLILAGTDNDYSVSQNASGTQFDILYNPVTSERAACELGTLDNCFSIDSNGVMTAVPVTDTTGYALIPGVLHAYKVSAADLAGYIAPVPEPETYAMLLAGLGLMGFISRPRRLSEKNLSRTV